MRFYRLHRYHQTEGSGGFEWFTRKDIAEREARRFRSDNIKARRESLAEYGDDLHESVDPNEDLTEPTVEAVDIPPTRAGILAALQIYATHPDNG